jgi:hypothetical protein
LPFVQGDFAAEEFSSPLIIGGVLILTAVLIYVSIQKKVAKVNA